MYEVDLFMEEFSILSRLSKAPCLLDFGKIQPP